ncbi:glycosylated lysosomal membrane protein A-like [Ischnura elegans]|uniref:glycosylated lysosomal membrane protein A-like n=1 Tax=Ischnura elegans TaxID=197161 RepID=UPI001ED8A470|nr:glycosylated lysosomal membrane protein A-like [Ischnura elegans]
MSVKLYVDMRSFRMMLKFRGAMTIFVTLAFLTFISSCYGLERKLTTVKNPGCDDHCDALVLLYIRADGSNDSLHYLWDFSRKPNVLIALTSLSANLTISWGDHQWNTTDPHMNFTEIPTYSFGMVVDKIWEFNDLNDTGSIVSVNNENKTAIGLDEFSWEYVDLAIQNHSSILKMKSYHGVRSGSIDITVTSFGDKDHGQVLPHLFHSSNSSQMDIVVNNLGTNPDYTSSRFAFELVVISQELKGNSKSFKILTRKSLDDEHTPGVFTVNDLVSPSASERSKGGGWLLWRRVSYTSDSRDINNSTEINDYAVENVMNPVSVLNGTLLHTFYGDMVESYLVQSTKVSFGATQDGFYRKNNYTTWTFLVGYGYPLEEEFSLLVILVVSIGLGVPAMLIIIGGIYMIIRGFSTNRDELFLSR